MTTVDATLRTIQLRASSVPGYRPATLADREPFINDADKILLFGNGGPVSGLTPFPLGKTNVAVGLENVDNTSDLDKPVSNAVAFALTEKLSIAGDPSNLSLQTPAEASAGLTARTVRQRWSDEVRITPDNCPLDYTTDTAPYLQKILTEAAALGKKVILPDTGNRYLPLDTQISLRLGVQRSGTGGLTGPALKDAQNQPLRHRVRIEGNNCRFVPRFSGFALDLVPTYTLAELAADSSLVGYNNGQLDIADIGFGLFGAPGCQAFRLGRQGRSYRDFEFYSRLSGISVGSVLGSNTAPADHAIRFEGDLYGINFKGWRLTNKSGLWMTIDSTYPGAFQGMFVFENFQAYGTPGFKPLRVSIAAATSGSVARSEIRGLHFRDAQIYGTGTTFEADGLGNIGDIWFQPGCQFDGPVDGVLPAVGEIAIKMQASNAGTIFNCFWTQPYIQNYRGPAVQLVTDGNAGSFIIKQEFKGGIVTLVNTTGGIFDCEGLHAGGLILNGVDFQACTGSSYVTAVNADSVVMHDCTSTDDLIGPSTVNYPIALGGTVKRVTAIGNTLRSPGSSMIAGTTPTLTNLGGSGSLGSNALYNI